MYKYHCNYLYQQHIKVVLNMFFILFHSSFTSYMHITPKRSKQTNIYMKHVEKYRFIFLFLYFFATSTMNGQGACTNIMDYIPSIILLSGMISRIMQ